MAGSGIWVLPNPVLRIEDIPLTMTSSLPSHVLVRVVETSRGSMGLGALPAV